MIKYLFKQRKRYADNVHSVLLESQWYHHACKNVQKLCHRHQGAMRTYHQCMEWTWYVHDGHSSQSSVVYLSKLSVDRTNTDCDFLYVSRRMYFRVRYRDVTQQCTGIVVAFRNILLRIFGLEISVNCICCMFSLNFELIRVNLMTLYYMIL